MNHYTETVQTDLNAILQNNQLYNEEAFAARIAAIETIEFVVDNTICEPLYAHARSLQQQLESINERLFARLREEVRRGMYRGESLRALIDTYVPPDSEDVKCLDTVGYDLYDVFINGLLLHQPLPDETFPREPEMVFYQQTPARIMLALAASMKHLGAGMLYDVGSGLGHVPILIHLLNGTPTKGVEIDPAYCAYARRCVADLHIGDVSFVQTDARYADYTGGSFFFLYTPFTGNILRTVLARIEHESLTRAIWVYTYGPCTVEVARQPWLRRIEPDEESPHQLALFYSRTSFRKP